MRTAALGALLLCSCAGGLHARGERQWIAQTSVGIPSGGNLLWAGVDEDSPNVAAQVGMTAFVRDRIALLGLFTPYRYYDQENKGVHAVEVQAGARYYPPLEFHVGRVPVAFFLDALGGLTHGSRAFPQGGTRWNLTQEAGLGLEARVGERTSLLLGYHQRHLSNGRGGSAPDNPGYNDHQVFFGLAWTW